MLRRVGDCVGCRYLIAGSYPRGRRELNRGKFAEICTSLDHGFPFESRIINHTTDMWALRNKNMCFTHLKLYAKSIRRELFFHNHNAKVITALGTLNE